MKKILILLAVVGLTFTSCYQDEYEAPSSADVKQAYFATDLTTIAASTTPYDFVVNFTEAFTTDVILSYDLDGTAMQMTIPAGSTSALLGSVDISTNGNNHNAVLNNIASINNEIVAIDEMKKTTTVLVPYDGVSGVVRFYLDWGTGDDLDAYIQSAADGGGSSIDYSWFDQPEVVDFPLTEADGTYYIYANEYLFSSDLYVTLIAVEPDGTNHVFHKTIHGDEDVISFEKTTDAGTGDVTFTYSLL